MREPGDIGELRPKLGTTASDNASWRPGSGSIGNGAGAFDFEVKISLDGGINDGVRGSRDCDRRFGRRWKTAGEVRLRGDLQVG